MSATFSDDDNDGSRGNMFHISSDLVALRFLDYVNGEHVGCTTSSDDDDDGIDDFVVEVGSR